MYVINLPLLDLQGGNQPLFQGKKKSLDLWIPLETEKSSGEFWQKKIGEEETPGRPVIFGDG